MMTFHKLFALTFSFQCLMAQHFNCTDGTCSNSIIQCDNQNITDCIVDCVGPWTCDGSVIYGGSGDLTVSCDGQGACVGAVIYCPSDSICDISATNGASIDFVFASASSELSVTLSGNANLERSKIHCPWLRYDNETACHITVDGQGGHWYNNNAIDALLIYAMDQPPANDLLLECINPPCDGLATIAYEQNNESVACNIEPTVDEDLLPYMNKVSAWQCQPSVSEGESCSMIPTFVPNEFTITKVSENGKYFYFEDDYWEEGQYDFHVTDIWYEPTDEWIPVEISQGNLTDTHKKWRHFGHRYPLNTATEGDWEIGATVRRMHYEWFQPTCADGLQCITEPHIPNTCEKITTTTTYPTTSPTSPITTGTTDSSAKSFCVGFSLIFGCLFCLII